MMRNSGRPKGDRLPAVGPSGMNVPGKVVGEPMSDEDIADVIAAFAGGAAAAKQLGFDAVEFHGAHGYLLKDCAEADLLQAVRAVAGKKLFFSPTITQTLLEDYMRQMQSEGLEDSYDLLTDREKEVLQLLAEGKSNKEAAALLNVSLYTVETHRSRLMAKLNLHSTADIVLYAVRKRIIQ